MKALIQRVKEASVSIDNVVVEKIEKGLVVFLGIGEKDTGKEIDWMINKIIGLRIFGEEEMESSLKDNKYEVLIVSQFTLYGDVSKGTRPSFTGAAETEAARKIYDKFIRAFSATGISISTGEFQAMMDVQLTNWGPVTLMIEK